MKTRFENSSGFSLDDVRVHYYSDKPEKLQALGYTQGNQVYIAPGQEKHLGHELGHVVQQKQGIVKPTTTIGGIAINDDVLLEREADLFANYNEFRVQMKPAPCSGSGIVQMLDAGKEQRKPASDKIVSSLPTNPPVTGISLPLKSESAGLISSSSIVEASAETVGLELEIHEAMIDTKTEIPSKTVLATSSAEKMGIPTIQIVVDGNSMTPYCEIVSMPLHRKDAEAFLKCAICFRESIKTGKLSDIIATYNNKVKNISRGVFKLTVQGTYGEVRIFKPASNPHAFRHTNVSVPYEQIGVPDKDDFVRKLFIAEEQAVLDFSRKSAKSLVEEGIGHQKAPANLISLFTQTFFQSIVLGASGIAKEKKESKLAFSTLFKTSSLDAIFYILSDDEVTILNEMMKNEQLLSNARNIIKKSPGISNEKYQLSLFTNSYNLIKKYAKDFTDKSADVTILYDRFADLTSKFTHDTPRPDNVIKPVRDSENKSYVILEVRSSSHPMNSDKQGLSNPFDYFPKTSLPQLYPPKKTPLQKPESVSKVGQHFLPQLDPPKKTPLQKPESVSKVGQHFLPQLDPPKKTPLQKPESVSKVGQHFLPQLYPPKKTPLQKPESVSKVGQHFLPQLDPPKKTPLQKPESVSKVGQHFLPQLDPSKKTPLQKPESVSKVGQHFLPQLDPSKKTPLQKPKSVSKVGLH